MKILVPKHKYKLNPSFGPLFFFVGPVRGGDDWQRKCFNLISKKILNFYAAIPYYHAQEVDFPLVKQAMPPEGEEFPRQLNWERYYISAAAEEEKFGHGCVIAYCPAESKTNPRPIDAGPYACDTRGEIGELRGRMMHNSKLRVVVGIEEGFPSRSQIERNFKLAVNENFTVYSNLEETVEAAIKIATIS